MKKQDKFNDSNVAVVLGLGMTALGVMRNLGRNGVSIVCIDSDSWAIGAFSRYCTKKCIYSQATLKKNFAEYLRTLGDSLDGKKVLIPTEDKYVRFISDHRKELEDSFIFVMPDEKLCESIMNKRLFYNLALTHDAAVPATYFPQLEDGGIATIAGKITYPCIIKPVYSKEWDFVSTLKAIKASNPNDLIDKYHTIANHNSTEVLIQEIIPGHDNQQYSLCAYFNRESQPLVAFVARKLRQDPIGFGVGTYVKSAREPELEKMGIEFLKKIKYKGIAEIEFKRDSRDKKFKLIEINARSWTQNTLPAKSGVNIIYLSYLDALGTSNGQNSSYQTEVKWFNDFRDIFSSIQYIRKKELSLNEWVRSFRGAKEFATFSYDDPAPFFYFPVYSALRLLKDAIVRLKGNKLFKSIYWSYFFIKHEGVLFYLKLLFRRILRYERFFIMEKNLNENTPETNFHSFANDIDVKMATYEDIKDLQSNNELYAFENFRNKFSKVKTCFFAYYKNKFAALSWVYLEGDTYNYYKLNSNEAVIGPIYTRAEFRGRGVAPKLVNNICNYLSENGFQKAIGIVSSKNHSSIRMFEKAAFKNIGKFTFMKILGLKILPKGSLR